MDIYIKFAGSMGHRHQYRPIRSYMGSAIKFYYVHITGGSRTSLLLPICGFITIMKNQFTAELWTSYSIALVCVSAFLPVPQYNVI